MNPCKVTSLSFSSRSPSESENPIEFSQNKTFQLLRHKIVESPGWGLLNQLGKSFVTHATAINSSSVRVLSRVHRFAIGQGSRNTYVSASIWSTIMEFCIALQVAVFLFATFVTVSLDLIIIAVSSNLYETGTGRTIAKCCIGLPFFLQDKRRSCLRDRFGPESFDMHGIIGRRIN
jgi:hypothetical protein